MSIASVPVHDPRIKIALQDYLNLGSERTILALHRKYSLAKKEDIHAFVPTTDWEILATWERQYNWRQLAFQWDAEATSAYIRERGKVLDAVYGSGEVLADWVISVAEASMEKLREDEERIKTMSPLEILKFAVDGARMKREFAEKRIALKDPQQNQQTSQGFMAQIRNALLSFRSNQANGGGAPELNEPD